jgi:uncharacterized protein (DUF952 family)
MKKTLGCPWQSPAADEDQSLFALATVAPDEHALDRVPRLAVVLHRVRPVDVGHPQPHWSNAEPVVGLGQLDQHPANGSHMAHPGGAASTLSPPSRRHRCGRSTYPVRSTRHTWTVLIYKILLPDEWARFAEAGRFDGSPLDHESGFIHCSTQEQVSATVRRFFADAGTLVVVALDADALGDAVRWEASFPHVYADLPASAIVEVDRLEVGR